MPIDPRKLPEMPSLMIAGPGELHEEELEVLGSQVIAHYGDVWTGLHNDAVAAVGRLVGAADAPYVVPGTGTTCLDAAVFNVFEPGQRVAVVNTGFFGNRLMEIARQHGLEVTEVPVDVGAPADPARVEDVVGGADGVLVCHVDTATGVRHPIAEIAAVANRAGAVSVVDGIASVGGDPVDVDGMGLGALVTGSQKGLEAPPGLGILALGERGRERVEARSKRPESWYLDLKVWDWYRKEWGAWHPHPVTFPSNLLLPLYASVLRILDAGVQTWVERRADLAKRCREGLRALGLEPVPHPGAEASLVVAAWADDPTAIQKHLLANAGIMISGGLDPTAGRAIRVGLMGATATPEMVDRVIAGVETALAS
ncbi:MAG: aminotransferase class V-fold PLP-dependent enzyme [Actinomycetota bacterium]|nr:aminotransferase class V-fold PLP-dependent enzyme [Actinomycetota bacterium]